MDMAEGLETGRSFSLSSPARSSNLSQGTEAHSETVSFASGEGSVLHLSSSEEEDDEGTNKDESVDLPPQSILFEELLEVVTRAVAKLNIDWPTEVQEKHSKSKLNERFLRSKSLPPRWGLPFFPDLHTEVSRSLKKPFSARIFSPNASLYAKAVGLKERWLWDMWHRPSSLCSLELPTKPLRTSSSLVGKAYMAAGQAGACLHTMSVLQAYQADLLKEMDEGEDIKNDDIAELHRATDISLRGHRKTELTCAGSRTSYLFVTVLIRKVFLQTSRPSTGG